MSSKPGASSHSRKPSSVDSFRRPAGERRQSRSSNQGSGDALLQQGLPSSDTLDLNGINSGTRGTSMGNLADELADAFSDSAEEYESDGQELDEKDPQPTGNDTEIQRANDCIGHATQQSRGENLTYQRGEYDGNEYGSDTDLASPGLSPSLVSKVDAIESLARRGTESYGGPADDIVSRLTEDLRDLGSQSGVEGSASRLITAHSALTTHLAHQTRQLHTLTFSLLSPLVTPPDPDTVDDLIPLLVSLSEDMPRPSTSAFDSLTGLHSLTADLIATLSYLSDTLHMSRQTTTTATRKLKSAKEIVVEMRRDDALSEEAQRWLARGNWGERLQKRECAEVCGDVINGFEEVCNSWRARLLAQAELQA